MPNRPATDSTIPPPRPGHPAWRTPALLWIAAAALLLAAGFGTWQWSRYVRDSAWRELAIEQADYPLPPSDGLAERGERSGTGDAFAQAMEPYLRSDYATAELRLSAYLRQYPQDSAAALYRGVSLLLLARQLEAIAPLGRAARVGQEPVASEARWYLAQAYLKVADSRAAARELERLAGGTSPRRLQAQELLQRIESN